MTRTDRNEEKRTLKTKTVCAGARGNGNAKVCLNSLKKKTECHEGEKRESYCLPVVTSDKRKKTPKAQTYLPTLLDENGPTPH